VAATNFAKGIASELNYQLIHEVLRLRDEDRAFLAKNLENKEKETEKNYWHIL
jgi:hypothetical protein